MERTYTEAIVGRIYALCARRKITLNKLSEMSGVSHSTLQNLVKFKTLNPRVMTLHKVAIAFNMTLAEFLDYPELNDYSFEDGCEESE